MSPRFRAITRIALGTLLACCLSAGAWDRSPTKIERLLAQSSCPPVPIDVATPTIQEFATAQGACVTPAGQVSSDLASGVFVKNPTYIGRDAVATVGGRCLYRALSGGTCITLWEELRDIGYVTVGTTPPGALTSNNFIYPTNPSHTQYLDSRVAGTTTGTQIVQVSWIGQWQFSWMFNVNPTSCNIQPTTSDVRTMAINVVDCAPSWWHLGVPPNQRTLHAPATVIYIYIPPSMWFDLQGAATAAANDWNTAMGGTGVSLQVVDYPCGEGGNCVNLSEGYTGPFCAETAVTEGGYAQDGTFTAPLSVQLPNGASNRNWRFRPPDRLRRTMAHELGHVLGLHHTSCTDANAVMAPLSVVSPDDCNTPTGNPLTVSPTSNDVLAAKSSTYGNHVQTWCNF